MATFLIGLVILICGGALYGKFCENIFGPDDRETPAYSRQDGVDYVPMKTWRNSLINLLNIAGTGPIMGPIQGILFGPAAFLAIPIGNVIGGSMHDYFSGMICTRDGGTQMPDFVKDYTNRTVYVLYDVFICLLLLLVGAVFIYTPGDIATTQIFKWSGAATDPTTWIVYIVIFAYYFLATCLPIDKLIGRVYPIFGIILVFSALGIFVAIFAHQYPLTNIWDNWNTVSSTIQGVDATGAAVTINASGFDYGTYFNASHFIPVFFLTVACGILSGFHSTQTALVSRTIESEKNGRMCFYNMMIVEGFIAMCWAAGTMAMINLGAANGGLSMMGNSYLQLTTAEKALTNGALNASYIQAGDQFFHQIGAAAVTGVVCRDARHDRPHRRRGSSDHLRRYRAPRTAPDTGRFPAHPPGEQQAAHRAGCTGVRSGLRDSALGKTGCRRLQQTLEILRMVQPDDLPVRAGLHSRLDVQERQEQIRLGAAHPGCVLCVCNLLVYCA